MKTNSFRFIILASLIAAVTCAYSQPQQAARPQALTLDELRQREAVVFDALDLTRPELAAVAAAWKQHDGAAAEKAFAAYLRTRTTVEWGPDNESSSSAAFRQRDREVADNARIGKLEGGGNPLKSAFTNGDVDWYYNATQRTPGVAPDDEWQWQLNRMEFWGSLGRVYNATHDERYVQTFVRELRSWVAQAPVPDHAANVPDSAWRTIEAGIRMGGSWPQAFFDFRHSPSITDADLVLFAGAILDHGRYLSAFNTRLNWFTMEMSGLYAAGALFPEFKEAADWRSFAGNHLAEEARKQFLSDGAQAELSTSYQNVALGNILKIAEIARWNGRTAELPADYSAPLEKGYEWQMNLMAPDHTTPRINDAGINPLPALFARMAVPNLPNRADFKWVATSGAEGKQPDYTSIYLNRSGLAVMRSGWDRDANYLVYRLGPLGMGHMHQDKLNLIIDAYGRELVFDSGGGSYEHSKWRAWVTSTYSHNCVIVDGMAQNRATNSSDIWHDADLVSQGPIDANWQSNEVFDFATGEYTEGYGPQRLTPAAQRRDVLFLKPDLYIIADHMRPNDTASHKYEARWQLLSTHTALDPVTHALETTDAGQANLAIVPLLDNGLQVRAVSAQEDPEILGWDIRRYEDPERAPATTLLHTQTGAGSELLLTLFVPLKPGEHSPIASVAPGQDGTSATVTFKDGRKFKISAPGEQGIAVSETLPNGSTGRSAKSGGNE